MKIVSATIGTRRGATGKQQQHNEPNNRNHTSFALSYAAGDCYDCAMAYTRLVMELYNNTLCVAYAELVPEILTGTSYDKLCQRKKIKVIRRGCYGTPALVEYASLPGRIKSKVVELYGDPASGAKKESVRGRFVKDEKARNTFLQYRFPGTGASLPAEKIEEYTINASVLNAALSLYNERVSYRRSRGGSVSRVWSEIAESVTALKTGMNAIAHTLPDNDRRLRQKLEEYKTGGYEVLINGRFGNKNTEKISDEAKIWLLARWADRVKRVTSERALMNEYNDRAAECDWREIKSVQTIHNFLFEPEIQSLWYGHRYGELEAKEKYAYQHSTQLPSMRDSLWYSDGTKLNFFYRDENGKMATIQVYEVMDVYSELFLGYHISKSEDYQAQFSAYRMALQTSGQKPYQISFDNQGGHKKLEASQFLGNVSRLATKTAPYNGNSKTIENAFGRFQAGLLAKEWFFTGQNITAKKKESRANMEFIMANLENLPTKDEVMKLYAEYRKEWNTSKHPKTGQRRIDMYRTSVNPALVKIDPMEMVNLFWMTRQEPVTATAFGITFKIDGAKYTFCPQDINGMPDIAWLRRNVDRQFIIKYDPQDLSLIYLYEETPAGLRLVCGAENKVVIHRGKQEQEEWEGAFIKEVQDRNKQQRVETAKKMDEILTSQGMSANDYGLNNPAIKGIQTSKAAKAAGRKTGKDEFGKVQKAISNMDPVTVTEDEEPFNPLAYLKANL